MRTEANHRFGACRLIRFKTDKQTKKQVFFLSVFIYFVRIMLKTEVK